MCQCDSLREKADVEGQIELSVLSILSLLYKLCSQMILPFNINEK